MPKKSLPPPELPWSLHKSEGWQGQYARLNRWLVRMRSATAEDDRADFTYAYFVSCNSLYDWLLKEVPSIQAKLEELLATNGDLRVARDIGNMHKHRTLTDPKRGREPVLAREYTGPSSPSRTVALSRGETSDIYDLAQRCYAAWGQFLKGVSLLPPTGAA
jgi:hypothetical protein